MPTTAFQPSFAGGEFSPELGHRVDLQKYAVGAATIKNMYVLPRGGLRSRPGTKYIAETKDSTKQSRLVEFIFSTTQAYILEFGDHYMRVIKDGGQVISGPTPYEIETPYAVADIWELKFEQSADTEWIVKSNYAPRRLTRTDHAAWTLTLCDFTNGPLMKENDTDISISLSDTNSDGWVLEKDTTTATASSAIFNASHVGSIWGIRYVSHAATYTTAFVAGTPFVSDAYRVFGDWEINIDPAGDLDTGQVYIEKSIDDGVTWFTLKAVAKQKDDNSTRTITGSEDEPCMLRVTRPNLLDAAEVTINVKGKEAWACFKITAYNSSTSVTAVMQNDFNRPGAGFKSWAEGSWSDYRGWPGAISFYQNRLAFGGTTYEPNGIWPSSVDDYEDFKRNIPQVDDNAIYQRLVGRQVNGIKWLVPIKALVCLTDSSEWTLQPGSDGTLSPDSMKLDQQTFFGASEQVEPAILGNTVVFAQRNGNKVLTVGYDYAQDKYDGDDLSIMSDHLFDGYTIIDWAYQQTPSSILWVVRSDGAMLSFTYHKKHDVWAWAQHYTDGKFESVSCIPGDGQDDVYFVVNRTINGSTKRYIEMLSHRDVSSKAAFFGVDCGATYSGTATATISGLSFLEGEKVTVNADGKVYTKTVSSGAITLDKAASTVHVGLGYEWLFKSLQVDLGNTSDRKKLVSGIGLSVISSQGGKVQTPDCEPVPLRYPNDTQELYSGDILDIPLTTNWNYNGQVIISGNGAVPMHITTIMPQVNVGGK